MPIQVNPCARLSCAFVSVMAFAMTSTSSADDAASTTAPTETVDSAVPKLSCPQPRLPERFSVAPEDMQHLIERVNAYARCVKEYVDARQAAANRHNDLLKLEIEAGNAAIKEINEFQTHFRAFQDRHDPAQN